MPKQRTGYVYYDKKRKTWTARRRHSSTIIDGAKLTFTKLVDIYRDEKLIEPVYEDGKCN